MHMGLLKRWRDRNDEETTPVANPDQYRTDNRLIAHAMMVNTEHQGIAARCQISWTEQGSPELFPGVLRRTPAEYHERYHTVRNSEELLTWLEEHDQQLRWAGRRTFLIFPDPEA